MMRTYTRISVPSPQVFMPELLTEAKTEGVICFYLLCRNSN